VDPLNSATSTSDIKVGSGSGVLVAGIGVSVGGFGVGVGGTAVGGTVVSVIWTNSSVSTGGGAPLHPTSSQKTNTKAQYSKDVERCLCTKTIFSP
jgi:hypothetical protein